MRVIFLTFVLLFFLSASAFSFDDDPGGGGCPPDDPLCDDGYETPLDDWVLVLVGVTVIYSGYVLKKNLAESQKAL